MSALALVTSDDLVEEAAAVARERADLTAAEMERQAAALLELATATRALAVARAAAAEAGVAQWCVDCDDPMPISRSLERCPCCQRNASKARWAREERAAARETTQETHQ